MPKLKEGTKMKKYVKAKKTYNPKNTKMVNRYDIINLILEKTNPIMYGSDKKAMTIKEAAASCDITYQTFCNWLAEDSRLKAMYDQSKERRKEMSKIVAKSNIDEALEGKKRLKDKEIVEFSFRYLEKTDKDFQPTNQLEVKSLNMNIDTPMEELQTRLNSLLNNN